MNEELREYNIYAGLGGSFGGASYYSTILAESEDEACDYAYELAVNTYHDYEGEHGVPSWQECAKELDYNPENLSEEEEDEVDEVYSDSIESWIAYKVVLTSEDNIPEDELVREHDLC